MQERWKPTVGPIGDVDKGMGKDGSHNSRSHRQPRPDVRVLARDLINDFQLMLKQETRLWRSEISDKLSLLKTGSALVTAAMIAGFVGFQVLVAMMIVVLAEVMPWWLSAFAMAAMLIIAAVIMAKMARSRMKSENLKPHKSTKSLHEMGEMLQHRAEEFKQSS